MKTPSGPEEASEPKMPPLSTRVPGDVAPPPRWARAGLQRWSRPSPANPGGPALTPQADVDPGGVFFSSSYLKKKQNSPHSPHVKCRCCCRQTIILQSHDDPCAEKKIGKACVPPHPSLGEATFGKAQVAEDQTHLLRNNRRWGRRRGRGQGRRKQKV